MNARLKLFFLANLSRQKIGSDRGFALPMALMVGMVILVVGATMIIRAQGDQSKIIAQTTSNKAMAIAEAGATRYVEFLNNNRGLIPYDSCAVVNTTTGACADDTAGTTTTTTWVTAKSAVGKLTGIGGGTSPEPVGGTTSCNSSAGGGGTPPPSYQTVDSSTISSTWANATSSGSGSGWRNLPNDQNPEGQYRLVAYKVDRTGNWADPNNPPSNFSATLVVEGRVNVSGTGASATDAFNTGKARVAFTIPVTASTVTGGGGNGFPGLWSRDFNGGGNGSGKSFPNNVKVRANTWDSSGCLNSDGTALNTSTLTSVPNTNSANLPVVASGVNPISEKANNGNSTKKDLYTSSASTGTRTVVSQAFPNLPNLSTSATADNQWYASTAANKNDINCTTWTATRYPKTNDRDSTGKLYGSSTNPPAPDATYIYNCSGNFEGPGSNTVLGQSGREKLVFYVNGYFHSGGGNLTPYCSGGTNCDPTTSTFTRAIFYIKGNGDDIFKVNADGNVGDFRDPSAIQAYVYGSSANTWSSSGSGQGGMELKGNGLFSGFLFAPFAGLSVNGTTDNLGAAWVKSIQAVGGYNIWQGIFGTTRLEVTIPTGGNVTTFNLDGQPSSWQRTSLDTVTVPSVPTGITGTSAVQPSISWPANSTGATPNYYTLFRCQTTSANGTCTPGTPVKAYKQGSSTYSYAESFQPTASQRKFCYAATASNAGGDSARSSVVCGADKT
jgi:hypothetical protein